MTHQHPTQDNSEHWASPAGQHLNQSQYWQGQAGPYYDPAQHYYDPNNPTAWQQATQYPNGQSHRKPVHKQWWFITILVVVVLGVVAIALAVASGQTSNDDVGQQPGSDAPAAPLAPEDSLNTDDLRVERTNSGQFVLPDGGTEDQALATVQERLDAGYSYYGPADFIDLLRYEGYQNEAIEYALNSVDVDWNEQALGTAQRMGDSEYSGHSAQEIQESLSRSGFIDDEVQYALDNIDIDYNAQALQALESYTETFDDYSDDELRQYLEYAGFQGSEIDHAFDNID